MTEMLFVNSRKRVRLGPPDFQVMLFPMRSFIKAYGDQLSVKMLLSFTVTPTALFSESLIFKAS